MPQVATAGTLTSDEIDRQIRRVLNTSWAGVGDGLSGLKLNLTMQLLESQSAEIWLRCYVNGDSCRKAAADGSDAKVPTPVFVSSIHEAGWRAGFEGREADARATLAKFNRASLYLAGHLRGSRQRSEHDPAPSPGEVAGFSP